MSGSRSKTSLPARNQVAQRVLSPNKSVTQTMPNQVGYRQDPNTNRDTQQWIGISSFGTTASIIHNARQPARLKKMSETKLSSGAASFASPPPVANVVTALDLILVQIGRLPPEWAGSGSLAPSDNALRDVAAVLTCLPPNTPMPELEVDPEDGYINLLWRMKDNSRIFVLTFAGAGAVIGSAAGTGPYEPWRLEVSDEIGIAMRLEQDDALACFGH